ncbi:MAG TPA: bifunctional glutamate N-acetyltransferase/amino-acid acetyltransferase ArgJ [Actinomycetota bacterium]|mgnify:CR=1 FL=1|nr:bifunctional glutamate N-acetyltransferase/amino-acid acetyltransferase ArgJ [Actinomycetota bacterium]
MSVTAAVGFRAAGVAAGLKASGQPDVALVVNDGPEYVAAGVFTGNRVVAAPVLWSREVVKTGALRAVVLNSGGANACTGPSGFADTHHTAEHAAQVLGLAPIDVAVCSTGLIGIRLDLPALLEGVDAAAAALTTDGGADAAVAIMTTDSHAKEAVVRGDGVTVGGMVKGAGMIAPGMATMLAVLSTDAVVSATAAARVLSSAVARTFNRIDSDGCMSTNDTVILMASGASGITLAEEELGAMVQRVCQQLARDIIGDAEGASKDVRIEVSGAASEDDAVEVGRAVARSNLFKCAMHGEDPNWGRIVSAVGTTAAAFSPDELGVTINGVEVCRDGAAHADPAAADLSDRQIDVNIDLRAGDQTAVIWTNDLTAAYVHENSAYAT